MSRVRYLTVLAAIVSAGCAETEPFQRADTWTVTGVNATNLAAMVDDPRDLARGRGLRGQTGAVATAAIDRLMRDRVKPLGDQTGGGASASPVAPSSSSASQAN